MTLWYFDWIGANAAVQARGCIWTPIRIGDGDCSIVLREGSAGFDGIGRCAARLAEAGRYLE